MSKKLYVQAVTPSLEVSVKPEGSSEKAVIFGFKVLGIKARKERAVRFEENRKSYQALLDELALMEAEAKLKEVDAVLTESEQERLRNIYERIEVEVVKLQEINLAIIKEDLLFIKGATARDYDELGKVIFERLVPDTRTAEPCDYWETPAECLNMFIEAFLDSKAWLDAIQAAHTIHMEKDFKELQAKN
jgi:hypothetical protein